MKKYILKVAGIAALFLLLIGPARSQDKVEKDKDTPKPEKVDREDEIIIRSKGDKDGKVTVEIKDGQVFINGKPVNEFIDDGLSVEVRKMHFGDHVIAFGPSSPFRDGGWNYKYKGDLAEENRAFLGVSSNKATGGGAEITEVTKESAAEKIGLKKGDVILKIDETKIETPGDLIKTIRNKKPGDKVVVTYKRDGKEQKVTAELGKSDNVFYWKNFDMPDMNENFDLVVPPPAGADGMGRSPRIYSFNSRNPKIGIRAQDREDGKGVKVIDVDDDSPADKAGIKEGDIISQFDGKNISSANELAELARANGVKTPVKIKITRAGKPMDIEVKIPKKLKTAEL
jgi:serine protease Do